MVTTGLRAYFTYLRSHTALNYLQWVYYITTKNMIFKPSCSALFPFADFALLMMTLQRLELPCVKPKGESDEVCYEFDVALVRAYGTCHYLLRY